MAVVVWLVVEAVDKGEIAEGKTKKWGEKERLRCSGGLQGGQRSRQSREGGPR